MSNCDTPLHEKYLCYVIDQYDASPNLKGIIKMLLVELGDAQDVFCDWDVWSDLDTIGKKVGLARCQCDAKFSTSFGFGDLSNPCCDDAQVSGFCDTDSSWSCFTTSVSDTYFGFIDPDNITGCGGGVAGFSENDWRWDCGGEPPEQSPALTSHCMNDDEYEKAIEAKRIANRSLGDVDSIVKIVAAFYSCEASLVSSGNGEITVAAHKDLTNEERSLTPLLAKILPLPPSIKFNLAYGGNIFTWGHSDGWCDGEFLIYTA